MSEPYVLVVDDDRDARSILIKILGTIGLTVREAENGKDALEIISHAPPALIILDLMMPVMNGFEVLFHLRGDPRLRYIPVLVVSAVSQEDLLMIPGVKKVIRKAYLRVSEVQEVVTGLLSNSYAHDTNVKVPHTTDTHEIRI